MTHARRQFLILAAREWLGTPFAWNQRVHNQGVDCVQLIIAAGMGAGLLEADPCEDIEYPSMAQLRHHATLARLFGNYLDPVRFGDQQPGDIGFYRTQRNLPMHLGLLTERGIIHASWKAKKVVETGIPAELRHRTIGFYQFKALSNG